MDPVTLWAAFYDHYKQVAAYRQVDLYRNGAVGTREE